MEMLLVYSQRTTNGRTAWTTTVRVSHYEFPPVDEDGMLPHLLLTLLLPVGWVLVGRWKCC